jgi:ATP-binding cassette subfamily B protein
LFREFARDKIALIVSHRLGLARMADQIIVMDGGRIVEHGDHDALMRSDGLYRALFDKQASSYVDA